MKVKLEASENEVFVVFNGARIASRKNRDYLNEGWNMLDNDYKVEDLPDNKFLIRHSNGDPISGDH